MLRSGELKIPKPSADRARVAVLTAASLTGTCSRKRKASPTTSIVSSSIRGLKQNRNGGRNGDVVRCRFEGQQLAAQSELEAARCLEIEFNAYLRPSEAVCLKGRDFFRVPNSDLFGLAVGSREFNETAKTVATMGKAASTSLITGIAAKAAEQLGANGQQMGSFEPSTNSRESDLHRMIFAF